MRLYTENQVRDMLTINVDFDSYTPDVNFILNEYTPIELPSDKEIEDAALSFCNAQELSSDTSYYGFLGAAQWFLRKIKNGNNE